MKVKRTSLVKQGNLYLKPENLQSFGSYKIRGVCHLLETLDPHFLKQGVATISAGNMAQAVAAAARDYQVPCQVFVPESAPKIKKEKIRSLGAEVLEKPFSEIWDMVKNPSHYHFQGYLIHPTQTKELLLGYGKIADEILLDLPEVENVVIPFGLGGLALGVSRRLKQLKPSIKIFLAEVKTASPFKAALDIGQSRLIHREASFVDAIGTPEVLPQVFEELKDLISDSLVVDLVEVALAIRKTNENFNLILEGAAACALAAAEHLNPSEPTVSLLSGGNIDPEVLSQILNPTELTALGAR